MKLSYLLKDLHYEKISGSLDYDIRGVAYDSRMISKDFVFVCICGFKSDGHNYVNEAINKGVAAVIIEKDVQVKAEVTVIKVADTRLALALISASYFNHPSDYMRLIGVTGTNGKTTTTYLVKSILEKNGYNTSILGTISNIIGGCVIEAKRTTPESYDLQKLFFEMKERGTDYCVMEVSSHSLELKRVEGCTFNVGIFTNLTRDHLDFHGTFQNYLKAKMKLFLQSKTAVINIDDEYSEELIRNIKIPVMSYSGSKSADVIAKEIEVDAKYSKFILKYGEEEVTIALPLPGRFNVYNALAAASACISEGISLEVIKNGLESIQDIKGRSEVIDSGRGFTIIIDYAHTPDGLFNIISTVREYVRGRIITLFGCGGDRDKTKRPIMGEIAGKLSDLCIVTSDNPRSEDPVSIIDDILPGIKNAGKYFEVEVDRREAIKKALILAQGNDVVIIAGKGHETYQVLKNETIHFDEREIVYEALKN